MKSRARGIRRPPPGGWPLDRVLVGVCTVRTFREMVLHRSETTVEALRGWDVGLWSGVSAQGATESLQRLHREGLMTELPPNRPGRARRYRLALDHPLCPPLVRLFERERRAVVM